MKKIICLLILFIIWVSCFRTGKYNGIDVSHHNNICWECVKKDTNIKFCYIKATEGKHFKDKKCLTNVKNAHKLNLNVGLYHYFRTNVSPIDQFNNFKSVYNKCNTNLIPVIDVEDNYNDFSNIKLVNKQLSELIELFYNEYKTYPIIYLGSFNSIKILPSAYKCKIWVRILKYDNFIPNFSIKQISISKVGCNYIDLNYSSNINKIKLNK